MEIIKSVLPVILLLLAGMLIRKKNIISEEGIKGLQALVMNISLPAGLFAAFYRTSISAEELILPVILFILVVGGIFAAKPLCRLFGEKDEYMPFMASGYEAGMLGYALIAILAGNENITTFAVMDMGQCLAIFTVYLALLKGIGGGKQTAAEVIRGLLTTPVLVAILAGLLVSVTGLGSVLERAGLSGIIDNVCSFASAPTSAAILVVIGYRMNFKGLDRKRVVKDCAIRLILQGVMAAVVLVIFKLIGGVCTEELTIMTFLLTMTLPPPYILPLYIEDNEKKEYYSLAISAYTLLSVIAFIVLVAIYV